MKKNGRKKKKYYHIFDYDTRDYLHSGRNSKTKRECLESYLWYRGDDLRSWWKKFKRFEDYIKSLSNDDIEEDMCACNFELSTTDYKMGE